MSPTWRVTFQARGREGTVRYEDEHGSLECHQEFGGGDIVACIRVGTRSEWETHHRWAVPRRDEILARIGSELIRQHAPSCRAAMDEATGWLNLIATAATVASAAPMPTPDSTAAPTPSQAAVAMVRNLSRLKRKLAMFVGIAALAVAVVLWLAKSMFSIATTGAPIGDSLRAGHTIATLIQRLEGYVPTLHRDPSKDRYSVGILLHDLNDTTQSRYVEIGRGHTGNALSLSHLLDADANWVLFQAPEYGALEIQSGRIVTGTEFETVRSRVASTASNTKHPLHALRGADRALAAGLASGGRVSPTRMMLLGERATLEREHRVGSSIRDVLDATRTREPAKPFLAELVTNGARTTIASISECPGEAFYRASFVRGASDGPLLVLDEPRSVLCLHEPQWFPQGNVFLSRLDLEGRALWRVDLGIDTLEQVIAGHDYLVLRGKRPSEPSRVPPPVLLVVELRTGTIAAHSLLTGD